MSIPKVRQWRMRTANATYSVLAPTRKLAVLNLRHEGIYDAISSVGAIRKQTPQHATVTLEGCD